MGFDIVISSENSTYWGPSEGRILCILPQSLYFPPGWGVSLLQYSFDNCLLNVTNCSFDVGTTSTKIPDSHFDDISQLLDKISGSYADAKFRVSEGTILCEFSRGLSISLNEPLRQILGFEDPVLKDGSTNRLGWNLWTHLPELCVNWRCITKQIVGENYGTILKTLSGEYKNIPYGRCVHEKFPEDTPKELTCRELSEIELTLTVGGKNPVSFRANSHVIFVLRFSVIQ